MSRPVLNFTGQTLEQEDVPPRTKDRLGPNQNNDLLLRECFATDISSVIFSSYVDEMKNLTETAESDIYYVRV